MQYCSYYQAHVNRKQTWFLVALLRSHEHCAFDRTLNKEEDIFEFFVPPDLEPSFVELLTELRYQNIIFNFNKLPNRLLDASAIV